VTINAEDHLKLVYKIASKYVPKNIPIMDSEEYSDGIFGLLKAIEKFDPEKNCKFSTLAYPCIVKSIIQGWRKRHMKKRFHLNDSASESGDKIENIPNQEPPEDHSHLIAKIFEDHPDDTPADKRNKRVLHEHFIGEKTWATIGAAAKPPVSGARAQQYGSEAQMLIRARFGIEELEKFFS